jgi:hypothetical protein
MVTLEMKMKHKIAFVSSFALACAFAAGAASVAQGTSNVPKTVGPFVAYCATNFNDCTGEIASDQAILSLTQEQDKTVCLVPRGVTDDSADRQILNWLAQHNELAASSTSDGVEAAIRAIWNCVTEIPNGQTYNGAPENTASFLSYCADSAHDAVCADVIDTASLRAYAASLGFKNGEQGHCSIPDAVKSQDALMQVMGWLKGRSDMLDRDIEDVAPYAIDGVWPCHTPQAAQQSFVDVPPGQQEVWQGYSVHVCPLGYGMAGAQVIANSFTCLRMVPQGQEGQVRSILDAGTQANFGRGSMHVCPSGMYMRGLHAINNWLICANGVSLGNPFLDPNGATQGNGMHMCPSVSGRQSVMTGIHDQRNDFSCASTN